MDANDPQPTPADAAGTELPREVTASTTTLYRTSYEEYPVYTFSDTPTPGLYPVEAPAEALPAVRAYIAALEQYYAAKSALEQALGDRI